MTAINTTIKTLITATDPGYHPVITPDVADFPYLNSPCAVILNGNDLKNNSSIAVTAMNLAITSLEVNEEEDTVES